MDIATTEKFLDDLAELPASVSKKCRDVLKELHRATASEIMKGGIPGWRLHKLQSSPFRSISVDMQYRMLVKIERDVVFAHRVVKHALADAPHVNRNDSAPAFCSVKSDELRFSEVADGLAELGMPSALCNRLRAARSDDDVLDALSEMPEQWSTTALELYEISDVLVPTARYTLLADAADLEDALANNNRAWDLYLHPSQRHIVELPWDVRVGICGSAGTGKTVCALHRVAALASAGRAVAIVCPNDDALMVSKQHLSRMLQGTNVDAYFLVPHAPNELAQIVGAVDHVVVDEGQEIPPTWYEPLNRAETRRCGLTIFFDLNQLSAQIPAGYTRKFHERKESWDSAVLRQLGCIALSLHVNYRNSREIAECYFHLLKESLLSPITAEVPVFCAGPVIRKTVNSASGIPNAVFQIVRQLRKTYADGEIGIVSSTSEKVLDGVSEVLKSAGVSAHSDPSRSDGVLVAAAIKVRGYERRAVVVIVAGLEGSLDKVGRAIRTYIAMSRARETLVIVEVSNRC